MSALASMNGAARSRGSPRGQAGFTMVELTVALLSGLIVGMGMIALSREATNTFNDEGRASASEASLRAAIDRLRGDLERAGYMSTGNILKDPTIAVAPGSTPGASNGSAFKPGPVSNAAGMMGGLQGLASIFWIHGGSNGAAGGVANGLTLSGYQSPALSPDIIQIGGNMTTAEQFETGMISSSGAACPGTKIYLSPTSPAMLRLFGGVAPTAANQAILQNAFQPDGASQFIARLTDGSGKVQYLATCPTAAGTQAAGVDLVGPYVAIDASATGTPIFTQAGTSGGGSRLGGTGGLCAGDCWVNPVQIVQWEITRQGSTGDNEPTQDSSALGNTPLGTLTAASADPNKYDLMRSYLDAKGTIASATREIVAEYAVDLAFAFTGDTVGAGIESCAFDQTACNSPWGVGINSAIAPRGPQRIRTVRARLSTRTAQADRTVTVPVRPLNYSTQAFLYRYAFTTANAAPYARARTLTTEVALVNQMRNTY